VKLSKEVKILSFYDFSFVFSSIKYHPDSNAADKTLHEKFVKINEAFSVLSKQSTRSTYDQSITEEKSIEKEISLF